MFVYSHFTETPPIWSWERNPSFLRLFCHKKCWPPQIVLSQNNRSDLQFCTIFRVLLQQQLQSLHGGAMRCHRGSNRTVNSRSHHHLNHEIKKTDERCEEGSRGEDASPQDQNDDLVGWHHLWGAPPQVWLTLPSQLGNGRAASSWRPIPPWGTQTTQVAWQSSLSHTNT
jgi:hypothetical protein